MVDLHALGDRLMTGILILVAVLCLIFLAFPWAMHAICESRFSPIHWLFRYWDWVEQKTWKDRP